MSLTALADRDLSSTTVARWTSRWLVVACGLTVFASVRYYFKRRREHDKLSREQIRRSTHRGIACSVCEQSPIRGIRYKCANCNSYDLCEQCEARSPELHDKTHLFVKIRIPIPPLAIPTGPLLSVLYPGKNPRDLHLNPNEVHVLQRLTHFDQVEIEDLFEQFKSLANSRGGIDKQTFEHCLGPLGVARNLITERLFAFFDQDSNGRIDFSELVCGLSVLCKGTSEEKIKYAFRGYDLDSDGYITQEELFKMFKAYFYLSKEAIKDAIKTVELDALGNFDESGTDPVSAAFAQIQSAHQQHGASNNAAINSTSDTATSNALPAVGSERQVNNVNTPQSDDAENSNANEDSTTINGNAEQSSLNSSAEMPEDTESRDDSAVTDHQQQSDTSINGNEARDLPGPSAQRTSLQKIDLSASVDLTDYLKPNSPRTEVAPNMEGESEEVDDMSRDVSTADMNDVLEKLYQKAIEDMASRAFHAADVNKDGKISFEEFKAWAEKDPTMTLWLEALGSIF